MKENKISIQKTAFYYSIGEVSPKIEHFWICCHGYGQSAAKFIYKFDDLDNGKTLVVAPEGLSKFYFGGFTGEVGASWMTKKNREEEIEDYVNYIDQIYQLTLPQLASNCKVHLLGFSQGAATISRFLLLRKPKVQTLIMWAGQFAHDLDFKQNQDFLKRINIKSVLGNQDQFINEEGWAKMKAKQEANGIKFETIRFEGKHKIDREVLQNIINKID